MDKHGTPKTIDDLHAHELLAWHAPHEDPYVWPTLQGANFRIEPRLIATDVHFLRRCCIEGLGIALLPDAMIPDSGLVNDSLVPVLPDIVGRERVMRLSVPKALAEVPKIKVLLEYARQFLQAL